MNPRPKTGLNTTLERQVAQEIAQDLVSQAIDLI